MFPSHQGDLVWIKDIWSQQTAISPCMILPAKSLSAEKKTYHQWKISIFISGNNAHKESVKITGNLSRGEIIFINFI